MIWKKNDYCTVTIEDIGSAGEGIGKVDGYTLFIKDAVIGDVVKAKIMKAKKNYGYARLEEIIESSPYRVTPKCKFARQCGGCQMQALSYEKQLEYKHNKVKNHFIRIGGFSEEFVDNIMESPQGMGITFQHIENQGIDFTKTAKNGGEQEEPFHYRNKAQFPIGTNKEGKIITGFYGNHSHTIIPNLDCALLTSDNQPILEEILGFMEENHISAYQEETRKGLVRHVLIRKGFATGQLMVCLVINGKDLPQKEKLIARLTNIQGMTSISLSINKENTNVIMGKEIKTIWGEPEIEDTIDGISFRISPLSFYQVNPIQTERIYAQALAYANLTGAETVWDLYCGIGTISLFLAQKAKQVFGVEIIPEAIADAKDNASRNQIDNVEFFVGKAEEVLPEKYKADGIYADVIVVDPPRKGCDEVCLQTMIEMKPKR
ncbi:MAG: 23S rRNA (uracil(1939)-C(5))-methyltransferase RlmD, partial [Eubacteriales bacterium]